MSRKSSNALAVKILVFLFMLFAATILGTRITGDLTEGITLPITLAISGEAADGVVTGCAIKKFKTGAQGIRGGRSSPPRSEKTFYRVVATTEDGATALGSLFQWTHNSDRCDARKGERVSIRLHPDNPDLNRVASFADLWYLPIQLAFAAFWIFIAAHIKPLAWLTVLGNLAMVFVLFWQSGAL